MTVAVLYSLVMYVVEGRRKARADHEKSAARHESVMTAARADSGPRVGVPELTTFPDWQLRQSRGIKQLLWACIGAGTLLMLVMLGLLGAPPLALAVLGAVAFVLAFLLSGLGGLLSLQVGASASPVSGTVFMGLLVLSVTALSIGLAGMTGVAILVPLVVATCVAICAANDSSQDYKTVQLTGFKVTDSFVGPPARPAGRRADRARHALDGARGLHARQPGAALPAGRLLLDRAAVAVPRRRRSRGGRSASARASACSRSSWMPSAAAAA
jgi:hypothetical protein